MNRRWFLGLLGAAASNPLWVKTKLISIPKVLHVPQVYNFGVMWPCPIWKDEQELLGPLGYSKSLYELNYLRPAADSIKARVMEMAEKQGRELGSVRFLPIRVPVSLDSSRSGNILSLPEARLIRAYDPVRDRFLERLDVAVRI